MENIGRKTEWKIYRGMENIGRKTKWKTQFSTVWQWGKNRGSGKPGRKFSPCAHKIFPPKLGGKAMRAVLPQCPPFFFFSKWLDVRFFFFFLTLPERDSFPLFFFFFFFSLDLNFFFFSVTWAFRLHLNVFFFFPLLDLIFTL